MDRGQEAMVDNKGGCPWVICMGKTEPVRREEFSQEKPEYKEGEYYGGYDKNSGMRDEKKDYPIEQEQRQEPAYQQPVQPNQPAPGPGAAFAPGENTPQVAPTPGTENPPVSQPAPQPLPSPSPSPESSPAQASAPTPMTGGVISIDNPFFSYWWGR